ncbi:TetR/AcrR family transcriptional regulator [Luteococcus sediminum]
MTRSRSSSLLAERGFEATSPQMIQQRSGVGHGSMYHHYRGKEDLALDAISHMRGHAVAFLDGNITPVSAEPEQVRACIVAALDRLFARKEGQALVRLLADPVAGATESLATAT